MFVNLTSGQSYRARSLETPFEERLANYLRDRGGQGMRPRRVFSYKKLAALATFICQQGKKLTNRALKDQ